MTRIEITEAQIAAITAELTARDLIVNGKLVEGWGHAVAIPRGASSYTDSPRDAMRDMTASDATEWLRKFAN